MKNLFYELTIKSFKNNKIRMAATLVGVVISVAMITNIIFVSSSLYNFMINDIKYRFGDWSIQIENGKGQVKEQTEARHLGKGLMKGISYAYLRGGVNPEKPFIYISSMDRNMMDITDLQIQKGRLPVTDDEIVLPEHVMTNGGIPYDIGDTIKLEEGYRVNIINGEELTQRNPYQSESEVFIKDREKEYHVVGICTRMAVEPYMAAGYTALVKEQKPVVHIEDTFFQSEEYAQVNNIISRYYINPDSVVLNEPLLRAQGYIRGETGVDDIIALSVVLVAFIGVCGFLLMYNTFIFSLREHVKSYQILASAGATERQLRKASLYEGLFIALIGIPAGMILGSIGTFVLIHFFGADIVSMFTLYSKGILTYHVGRKWVVTALMISILMVVLSIILPAYKTGKIKPVENYEDDGITPAERKNLSRYNLFKGGRISPETRLALKNYRKNSRTYRYTIVSLTMSIALFICAGTTGAHMEKMLEMIEGPESSYDISYMSNYANEAEKAFVHLSLAEGVEQSSYMKFGNCTMEVADREREAVFYVIDDDTFEDYVEINNLEKDDYFDEENPEGLALSYITAYNQQRNIFEKTRISENEQAAGGVAGIKGTGEKIKINKYIDKIPENSTLEIGRFVVIMSKTAAGGLNIHSDGMEFSGRAYFKVKDNSKTYSTMAGICRENGLGLDYLINMEKERENIKSTMMVIKMISYTFIILVAIIAIVNMFNTISSSMEMRQYEFATLLSLGMSKKSLDKMIYVECLILGAKTLVYGIPLTELALYGIFKNSSISSITGYIFPWSSTILSIVILFVILVTIMSYGTYKVRQKDSASILKNRRY